MSDSPVTLDDFEFRDFEVPEHFPFGGSQKISEKNLIGGVRIADAMGALNRPVEWSGRFQGQDAMSRALELDAKRKAGKDLALAWGELALTVKILDFLPDAEKAFEIPFSITLLVVSDDTQPLTAGNGPTVDEVMSSDMDSATVLGDRIGDAPLSGLLGDLRAATGSVRSFTNAGQTALSGVLAPISAVQARVHSLIGSAEGVFGGVPGLGGVVSGVSPLHAAASLIAHAKAVTRCADLYDLGNLI
jgi:hypothetical protein